MRPHFSFGLLIALLGCGPRVGDDSSEGDEGPPDSVLDLGGDDDDGQSGPLPDHGEPPLPPPPPCPDGLDRCDDECVDLQTSNDHCGGCGNVCRDRYVSGTCEAGICPPDYECGGARTDFRDCSELCESLGTSCEDGVGCSGAYRAFYGLAALENCAANVGAEWGEWGESMSCSDPIQWDRLGGLNLDETPGAISCCCLQNF